MPVQLYSRAARCRVGSRESKGLARFAHSINPSRELHELLATIGLGKLRPRRSRLPLSSPSAAATRPTWSG